MPLNLKGIENSFEKFSTTTVIKVFSFIRTSTFRAEQLFWVVVLVGFSFATVWNVSETLKKFLSEPTASQFEIVAKGMNLSNAQMCLQIRSKNLIAQHKGSIVAVIAQIEDVENIAQYLEQKIDQYIHQEGERALKLISSLKNTEDELNALNLYQQFDERYGDLLTENDTALASLTIVMFLRLVGLELDPKPLHASWQSPVVKQLYEAYARKGTNFSALFDSTAKLICALLQIRIVSTQTNLDTLVRWRTPHNTCKHFTSVSYFGSSFTKAEMICYRLGGKLAPLVFQSVFDFVTFTMHPRALFGDDFVEDLQDIAFDLEEPPSSVEQHPIGAFFKRKQSIEISLNTASRLANLRRRPCSSAKERLGSFDECTQWCRLEQTTWACDCMPLMKQFTPEFARITSNLRTCATRIEREFDGTNTSRTTKCRLALSQNYESASANCSQQCSPNCEIFIFNYAVRNADPSLDYLVNVTTAVRLIFATFLHQETFEFVTMDGKAFVAALGGNLSLFLGASFLALIHIVVFIVRLPFEHAFDGAQQGQVAESSGQN